MDQNVPLGEKAIPEGTGGYSGPLGGRLGKAKASESRKARAKQQGKENRQASWRVGIKEKLPNPASG